MSKVSKIATVVDVRATIELNENEVRALDALAGYGVDNFIALFYKHMGEHYLKPHEAGLRSFLESVHGIESLCNDAQECRTFMADSMRRKLAERKTA